MKKFLAFTAAIFFVGALSLSVFAFTDDDPKNQKSEQASTEQCDQKKETASATEAGSCSQKKAGDTASAGSEKSAECSKTTATTADVK